MGRNRGDKKQRENHQNGIKRQGKSAEGIPPPSNQILFYLGQTVYIKRIEIFL